MNQEPTPQTETTNFVAVEDLINEFEQEKESTFKTEPVAEPTQIENAPTAETFAAPTIYATEPTATEKPPMDEATAYKETAKFMRFRENLQAYGIAYYADGNIKEIDQYKYTPSQFNQLVDAWSPIVQSANIKLPPMADIALAEIMCTGPLIGLMNQNRKYRKEVERLKKDNSKLQEQIHKAANVRRDSQRFWTLGTNGKDTYGFFTHNPAGQYLKKEERTERPELTDENIKLLVKHNGQAAIDKLLNK